MLSRYMMYQKQHKTKTFERSNSGETAPETNDLDALLKQRIKECQEQSKHMVKSKSEHGGIKNWEKGKKVKNGIVFSNCEPSESKIKWCHEPVVTVSTHPDTNKEVVKYECNHNSIDPVTECNPPKCKKKSKSPKKAASSSPEEMNWVDPWPKETIDSSSSSVQEEHLDKPEKTLISSDNSFSKNDLSSQSNSSVVGKVPSPIIKILTPPEDQVSATAGANNSRTQQDSHEVTIDEKMKGLDKLYTQLISENNSASRNGRRMSFLEKATHQLSLSTCKLKKIPSVFESKMHSFPKLLRSSVSLGSESLTTSQTKENPLKGSQTKGNRGKRESNLKMKHTASTPSLSQQTIQEDQVVMRHSKTGERNGWMTRADIERTLKNLSRRKSVEWPEANGTDRRQTSREGSSAQASTSSSDLQPTPEKTEEIHPSSSTSVRVIKRNRSGRSQSDISKRLSLPAEMHIPKSFLHKQSTSPTLEGPISRTVRRQSLSEIGFGRLESYVKLEKLGEGSYAKVYRGRSLLTDNQVALKVITLEHEEGAPCTAIREISLLKNLKHNNIVTLHDIIYTEKSLTLVFEYLHNDLRTYLDHHHSEMTFTQIKIFLFQLLRGLHYCHKRKVLHRDMKPNNILLNTNGELKLADFGLARAKSVPSKTYSNEVVTLWYRPPDVLLGSIDYSTSIDMWGVGCIFYEMVQNEALFPGQEENQLHHIFRNLGSPTEETWPGCDQIKEIREWKGDGSYLRSSSKIRRFYNKTGKEAYALLKGMLEYNTKKRISASDAMKHSYFDSLGPEVHTLPDHASIYSVPGITFEGVVQ